MYRFFPFTYISKAMYPGVSKQTIFKQLIESSFSCIAPIMHTMQLKVLDIKSQLIIKIKNNIIYIIHSNLSALKDNEQQKTKH